MEVKELGHVVLYVRDIGQSAHFYRDVLGWRQILPDEGGPSGPPVAAFSALDWRHDPALVGSPIRELRL